MPRRFTEFWVSPSAEEHIWQEHGVCAEELLEAVESSSICRPAGWEPRSSPNPTGQQRYMVAGKTEVGRRLWIVVADEGDQRGRIITAREVRGRAERARHRRMRGGD